MFFFKPELSQLNFLRKTNELQFFFRVCALETFASDSLKTHVLRA